MLIIFVLGAIVALVVEHVVVPIVKAKLAAKSVTPPTPPTTPVA